VTSAGRYAVGFAVVAGLGVAGVLGSPAELRREVGYGVLIGLVLQGPLGWWAVSALGTERFTLVWGVGILIRFAVLGLVAFFVVPSLHWAAAPVLLSVVAMLGALLAVESVTAARHSSQG
jgi:uncharacterized membrane protein